MKIAHSTRPQPTERPVASGTPAGGRDDGPVGLARRRAGRTRSAGSDFVSGASMLVLRCGRRGPASLVGPGWGFKRGWQPAVARPAWSILMGARRSSEHSAGAGRSGWLLGFLARRWPRRLPRPSRALLLRRAGDARLAALGARGPTRRLRRGRPRCGRRRRGRARAAARGRRARRRRRAGWTALHQAARRGDLASARAAARRPGRRPTCVRARAAPRSTWRSAPAAPSWRGCCGRAAREARASRSATPCASGPGRATGYCGAVMAVDADALSSCASRGSSAARVAARPERGVLGRPAGRRGRARRRRRDLRPGLVPHPHGSAVRRRRGAPSRSRALGLLAAAAGCGGSRRRPRRAPTATPTPDDPAGRRGLRPTTASPTSRGGTTSTAKPPAATRVKLWRPRRAAGPGCSSPGTWRRGPRARSPRTPRAAATPTTSSGGRSTRCTRSG